MESNELQLSLIELTPTSIYEYVEIGMDLLKKKQINKITINVDDCNFRYDPQLVEWQALGDILEFSEITCLTITGDMSELSIANLQSIFTLLSRNKLSELQLFEIDLWDFDCEQLKTFECLKISKLILRQNSIRVFSQHNEFLRNPY